MAQWSENAKKVLAERYLIKDKTGNLVETPDKMLERVARYISSAEPDYLKEEYYNKFLGIMDSLEFLPNSPTLINAGRKNPQLSACFVLPIFDSLDSIFEMVKQSALIHKLGGGTGFAFSSLRPAGAVVASTHGVASGPVSFMSVFNAVTEVVKQGGVRRGANMGILNYSHPDILEFIDCKQDKKSFNNFNISIGTNGGFFEKVERDESIQLRFRGFPYKNAIKARDIFDKLCKNAWETGEPGILFFDTINKFNPTPWLGNIWACNPCGEAPLLPFESCNLGSINLHKLVKEGKFDFDRLNSLVKIATRFLDDVAEVNNFPRIQIARATKLTRKIGLGVMGWADTLGALNIPYDSEEAFKLAEKVMANMKKTAYQTSSELAREKGTPQKRLKRRNACLLSIAPTGTLSLLANCSSGIEPHFAEVYTKNVINGITLNLGTEYKVKTAMEISPENHIRTLAAFQKYVDLGCSKTINLPNEATVEDVKKSMILAHSLGCKGLTVYRQGSREEAPLQELSECSDEKCLV